ncbi:MAG: signal recognition particle-docking protein FtsY [Actinomycetia bacterium]|nr:signal recognition particle-docking protein FtsY [Actinomycetes bacterium]
MDPILIVILVAVVAAVAIAAFFVLRRRKIEDDSAGRAVPKTAIPKPAKPEAKADKGLRDRLAKSRGALVSSLSGLFSSQHLSDDDWEELEDALVLADVGPQTAAEIVDAVKASNPETGDEARVLLEQVLDEILVDKDRSLHLDGSPAVLIVVGVNGTGKTTSIAKISKDLVSSGSTVVLGAADTFRAAADTQLRTWGDRVGVPVVSGARGADPASVAFEAYERARSDNADVLIVDTAGRLHSQKNLMEELSKVARVLEREAGKIDEVLLVLDGTTGQNGLIQAKAFAETIGITGVVLTKLDGTSRGGIAIAVERTLGVPIKFIGVGEGMDDLLPFEPEAFIEALIAR